MHMFVCCCACVAVSMQRSEDDLQESVLEIKLKVVRPGSKQQLRVSDPNSGFFPKTIYFLFKCMCVRKGHLSAGALGASYRRL